MRIVTGATTTSLTAAESAALFRKLEALRAQGVGIIYISHRLGEISRLADRITVLRDGRGIGTQDAAHLDAAALVKWMAGRAVAGVYAAKRRPEFNPLIVHVRDLAQAQTLVEFTPQARALAEKFWPGALTLVLPHVQRTIRHERKSTCGIVELKRRHAQIRHRAVHELGWKMSGDANVLLSFRSPTGRVTTSTPSPTFLAARDGPPTG